MHPSIAANEVLIEAEEFDDFGGWTLDSQFDVQMGSPYLLAHGLGKPVADAKTVVQIAAAGVYQVWVRAKDWVPRHHPGRFQVVLGGRPLPLEFGANDRDWSWEYGGTVDLQAGPLDVALSDLTGFDGRCDAIFLTTSDVEPPHDPDEGREWRRRLRHLPDEPLDAGAYDLIVVGGGVVGSAAALTAARLGQRVALVQDRPVLGGNASVEIGLNPRGERGALVDELSAREPDGDLCARRILEDNPLVSLFLEHTVFAVTMDGASIASVVARETRTGLERRFEAPMFIDCSGTAILGLLAGARTLFGNEAQAEFGEGLAPEDRLDLHHGNTVFFRTKLGDEPAPFPDVPWAVEVAKDFGGLSGQLISPGSENGEGPITGPQKTPSPETRRRMLVPATHFWEYGQALDPYVEGEHIRDHLLRAIYGAFSNVKRNEPVAYANLELDWVAFVPGQGEFRRYLGDHVLTENDIREHREFPDAVAVNSGAFCLHYGGDEKYDFRLKDWKWDERDSLPFEVPFSSLYSVDVPNVMMAGKHISVTHIAGSVCKHMGNGAQHAVAVAAASVICARHATDPRGVREHHMDELQALITEVSGRPLGSAR